MSEQQLTITPEQLEILQLKARIFDISTVHDDFVTESVQKNQGALNALAESEKNLENALNEIQEKDNKIEDLEQELAQYKTHAELSKGFIPPEKWDEPQLLVEKRKAPHEYTTGQLNDGSVNSTGPASGTGYKHPKLVQVQTAGHVDEDGPNTER